MLASPFLDVSWPSVAAGPAGAVGHARALCLLSGGEASASELRASAIIISSPIGSGECAAEGIVEAGIIMSSPAGSGDSTTKGLVEAGMGAPIGGPSLAADET